MASQVTDIAVEIIQENKYLVSFYVFYNFSITLSSYSFPTGLKYADVRPMFKKDDKTDKENYRPNSILPNLSKMNERFIDGHVYSFLDQIFSKLQCACSRGFNAELRSIHMIEKWRKYITVTIVVLF